MLSYYHGTCMQEDRAEVVHVTLTGREAAVVWSFLCLDEELLLPLMHAQSNYSYLPGGKENMPGSVAEALGPASPGL